MAAAVLLSALTLLLVCGTNGAMTRTLYVQTGDNLFLPVKELTVLGEVDDFSWKVKGNGTIVKLSYDNKTTIYPRYTRRVEFFKQNQSLLLKSVQKPDSGVYTAQISGGKDQLVAEYKVTVLDPVSPVKLSVIPTSFDLCNFTVSCSTLDSHINSTFKCITKNCSLQEGEERSEATPHLSILRVSVEEGFAICNHSNQVSWKQDRKDIKSFCEPRPGTNGASSLKAGIGSAAALAVLLVAALCSVVIAYKRKRKPTGGTIDEVPQDMNQVQSLNAPPAEETSGPTSTYALVQFHTGPAEPPKNNPHPETIYAQVNRSAKTTLKSPSNQCQELENIVDPTYLKDCGA